MINRKTHAGQYQVSDGDTTHTFDLYLSKRKSLTLRVRADTRLTIDAPPETPLTSIYEFVRKRSAWIEHHQAKAQAMVNAQPPRQYTDGETWQFLGRHYQLRLECVAKKEGVVLSAGQLIVSVRQPERAALVMRNWYLKHAREFFLDRMAVMAPLVTLLGITAPEKVIIRAMKTRWGTCSNDGRITLNLKLMQLDIDLLDYVIVHELCHLREFNHSPRFYALLDAAMPDWKKRRRTLQALDPAF